jgi:hypothetical protein
MKVSIRNCKVKEAGRRKQTALKKKEKVAERIKK